MILAPFLKKCSLKDPNLNTCLLEAAQDGISKLTKPYPEYKIPNADPLDIVEINISPSGNRVVNIEQKFKNCKLYGTSTIQFRTFE